MVPDGLTPVAGMLTPLLGGSNVLSEPLGVLAAINFGEGIQTVERQGSFVTARPVSGMRAGFFSIARPTARIATSVSGIFSTNTGTAPGFLVVVETPRMEADGTFTVDRIGKSLGTADYFEFPLTPLRRRSAASQRQGATLKFGPIVCAAADGVVVVDWYRGAATNPSGRFDTGDPDIQNCSIANVNGSIIGVASSANRSIAFSLQLPMAASPSIVIQPLLPQPYWLPPTMAEVGGDQGPFDVSLLGGLDTLPGALGMYLRQPQGASAPRAVFALFDRNFEYDSNPEAVAFPDLAPTEREKYTSSVWPNGQVAFARYNPATGVLNVATALCDR
ncbi:MAG: hypothetical protein U0269_23365 [Polyangiales bacterium]